MDSDSERDALHAAMTTAEHKNLGEVLDTIRRLDELRSRGLSSAQISERIRLTHPNRPGGGVWSPQAVERVLEIADENRRRSERWPTSQRREPTFPPPVPANPPGERTVPRPPAAQRVVGGDRPDDRRTPLRAEPRRYHRRPTLEAAAAEPDGRRRWRPALTGLLILVGLTAIGAGLFGIGVFDRFTTADNVDQSTTPETSGSTGADGEAVNEQAATGATVDPSIGATDAGAAPAGGAADDGTDNGTESLTIRIEPSVPETDDAVLPASATIRTDGKLYIEGAFRSESEAQRFLDSATEVFGEAALVPDYTIDPAAPDPTVSDVVLEKPVLFESGSAVIEPEYIPFLEACGDVLKLNSHIVMSVSAFTDATGNAEFNLELSQRRADAVIEFYRNLDIGEDQLISTGFGETDFVADNDTEEGRQQNRRAMLELLNVMQDG